MISRRKFGLLIGGAAVPLTGGLLTTPAFAQGKSKVVVIGGGAGGATAAKYIAKESAGKIEVTLVEPARNFVTCFHSNLVLGGYKSMEQITHSYEKLAANYGIKMAHDTVVSIDREKRKVTLAGGSTLDYDRLVVSPGVDLKYDGIAGWGKEHEEVMPHGWKAGPQTKLLKAKLDSVPDGGLIVVIAPPNPYRCPPGPYERVSMMAHVLSLRAVQNAR
jgi:sulfide dehydrogenase [flavocytochrome c] flavoprotein chain